MIIDEVQRKPDLFRTMRGLIYQKTPREVLQGHPVLGHSWEGYVIENIIGQLFDKWHYSYYRATTQAEIDLILEGPGKQVWAIEIKRSSSPELARGFYQACEDVGATRKFVIYAGKDSFPMKDAVEAMGIVSFLQLLRD